MGRTRSAGAILSPIMSQEQDRRPHYYMMKPYDAYLNVLGDRTACSMLKDLTFLPDQGLVARTRFLFFPGMPSTRPINR